MSLGSKLVSTVVGIVAITAALYFYDRKTNDQLRDEFSFNLNKWYEKGKYFDYEGKHRIFYVQEVLPDTVDGWSSSSSGADDEHGRAKQGVNEETDVHVVFLHGFPTSSYDYIKLWSLFKQEPKHRVKSLITFDYIGYGFSDKPVDFDYSLFEMADLVDALLMHLNIEKVFLVAHDVSDSVAQELIRRENLKNQNHFTIVKCVLLNGGVMTSIYKPRLGQELLRTQIVGPYFARYFFQYFIFKPSFAAIFGSLSPPNATDLYDFYLTIKYNQGNEVLPRTIRYMNEREQYGDVWIDALNETVVPVLFVYGPADPINPKDKFPMKMKHDLPFVKLAILSDLVGHYPQWEDPFTVYGIIKNFFF